MINQHVLIYFNIEQELFPDYIIHWNS